MFCTKCGKELRDGSAFCDACGAVQGTREAASPAGKAINTNDFTVKGVHASLLCGLSYLLFTVAAVCWPLVYVASWAKAGRMIASRGGILFGVLGFVKLRGEFKRTGLVKLYSEQIMSVVAAALCGLMMVVGIVIAFAN